jgi:hypothetical protein
MAKECIDERNKWKILKKAKKFMNYKRVLPVIEKYSRFKTQSNLD